MDHTPTPSPTESPIPVYILGSSIMVGLANAWKGNKHLPTHNHAKIGGNTADTLEYAQKLPKGPKIVVMDAGNNDDVFYFLGESPKGRQTFVKAVENVITTLGSDTQIYLVALTPPAKNSGYHQTYLEQARSYRPKEGTRYDAVDMMVEDINQGLRELAEKYPHKIHYVDEHLRYKTKNQTPFNIAYKEPDGLHITAEGSRVLGTLLEMKIVKNPAFVAQKSADLEKVLKDRTTHPADGTKQQYHHTPIVPKPQPQKPGNQ